MGGTDTTPAATGPASAGAAGTRKGRRFRAVSAIVGEAGRTRGAAGPVPGARSDDGLGERRARRQAPHVAEEIGVRWSLNSEPASS